MTDDVLVLDAAAVRRLLSPAAARASQREAFSALHRGTGTGTAPPRAVMPIGQGYTFCYSARHAPDAGAVVKVGSFTPENTARGLPAVSATVLVLDPDHGRLRAMVDGEELTTLRTAAASALAVEVLAPRLLGTAGPAGVAVLGSGVQGRAHVDAVLDVLPGASLRLWGRTSGTVHAWAEQVRAEHPGTPVTTATTPAQAVAGADVVLCCTSAHDPLLDAGDLAPRALVVSVGSVAPDRREVPGELVDTARVVVDSPADAASGCGPVVDAVARGTLDPATLTGLGAVLDGPDVGTGPSSSSAGSPGRTLHLSVGVGLQDAAAAWAVLAAWDRERAAPRRRARGPDGTPSRA